MNERVDSVPWVRERFIHAAPLPRYRFLPGMAYVQTMQERYKEVAITDLTDGICRGPLDHRANARDDDIQSFNFIHRLYYQLNLRGNQVMLRSK